MNRKHLDKLLWRWAAETTRSRDIGYPSESTIGRFMREGAQVPPDGSFSDPTANASRRVSTMHRLDHHVRKLEWAWLQVVVLRYRERKSWPDIAVLMGLPVQRCRWRLHDVMDMLADKLETPGEVTPQEQSTSDRLKLRYRLELQT